MPQGIGPIGIYHSHPFSSEIFHSHTDDATLLSLSNQFPNCISIVTNGEKINFYQMGLNSKPEEIQAEFIDPDIPKFLLISIDEDLNLIINNNLLNNKSDENRLKIAILNKLRDYLEEIWIKFEFLYDNSKVPKNDSINPYLVDKLTVEPIHLIIPEKFKDGNKIKLIIDRIDESEESKIENNQTCFNLNIKAKIPIYITNENQTFQRVSQAIKTELISNNILQKIYNCVIDYDKNIIITPDDYYLNFFRFYIRVLCFNKKELNETEFSLKNFEILLKLIALFENFKYMESNDKIRNQISMFIKNLKKFSKKFRRQNQLKNRIENLKKNIKQHF
ncbi:hypothetical protein LCGC14_1772850 [marine sediment metagenome]|uniref:JAB domain-containing protein n=1 Tax=marine sediment metagenome TaxID=412755 RepID=A0A0F9JXD9_9ZZZZ